MSESIIEDTLLGTDYEESTDESMEAIEVAPISTTTTVEKSNFFSDNLVYIIVGLVVILGVLILLNVIKKKSKKINDIVLTESKNAYDNNALPNLEDQYKNANEIGMKVQEEAKKEIEQDLMTTSLPTEEVETDPSKIFADVTPLPNATPQIVTAKNIPTLESKPKIITESLSIQDSVLEASSKVEIPEIEQKEDSRPASFVPDEEERIEQQERVIQESSSVNSKVEEDIKSVGTMKKCSQCGMELPEDTETCFMCGIKL